MKTVFLFLLNGCLTASVLIVLVILVRMIFRKAPKSFFCLLWAVAALRLAVPFSVLSFWAASDSGNAEPSETPSATVTEKTEVSAAEPEQSVIQDAKPEKEYSLPFLPKRDNPSMQEISRPENLKDNVIPSPFSPSGIIIPERQEPSSSDSVKADEIKPEKTVPTAAESETLSEENNVRKGFHLSLDEGFLAAVSAIWLTGAAGMLLYAVTGSIRLHRRVRGAEHVRDNICRCKRIDSPFILGIFRPKIYLPENLSDDDMPYVLAHEQAHIGRLDYITKPLAFIFLAVYWFNPLVWAAFVMFTSDVEAACDERVIRKNGFRKKAYSTALINCSASRNPVTAAPLAFGETAVKTRIKDILRYKKPKKATVALFVLIALMLTAAACTSPNPVEVQGSENAPSADESAEKTDESSSSDDGQHEFLDILYSTGDEHFEKVLGELRKNDIISLHKVGEPFENAAYDVIRSNYLDMYRALNEELSREELTEMLDTMFRRIDEHPYWTDGFKENYKLVLNCSFKRNFSLSSDKAGLTNYDINELISEINKKYDEETRKKYRAFYEAAPYTGYGFGEWYAPDNFISDAAFRLTLEQFLDALENPVEDDSNRYFSSDFGPSKVNIDGEIKEIHSDYGWSGSGMPGGATFYLNGQDEWITFPNNVYSKYDKETGTVKTQSLSTCLGKSDKENELKLHLSVPFNIEENQEDKRYYSLAAGDSKTSDAQPSDHSLKRLRNFSGAYAEYITEQLNIDFPDLTTEQLDKYLLLTDTEAYLGNRYTEYSYLKSVALGITDPSRPKLTIEKVREIIDYAMSQPGLTYYDKSDDIIKMKKSPAYYILKGIYDIQYFPDKFESYKYTYWNSDTEQTRTEEIVVTNKGKTVTCSTYDANGKITGTELLVDLTDKKFIDAAVKKLAEKEKQETVYPLDLETVKKVISDSKTEAPALGQTRKQYIIEKLDAVEKHFNNGNDSVGYKLSDDTPDSEPKIRIYSVGADAAYIRYEHLVPDGTGNRLKMYQDLLVPTADNSCGLTLGYVKKVIAESETEAPKAGVTRSRYIIDELRSIEKTDWSIPEEYWQRPTDEAFLETSCFLLDGDSDDRLEIVSFYSVYDEYAVLTYVKPDSESTGMIREVIFDPTDHSSGGLTLEKAMQIIEGSKTAAPQAGVTRSRYILDGFDRLQQPQLGWVYTLQSSEPNVRASISADNYTERDRAVVSYIVQDTTDWTDRKTEVLYDYKNDE